MGIQSQKKIAKWFIAAAACSCAWAVDFHFCLSAMDRGQGWVDLVLIISLYLLLGKCFSCKADRKINQHSIVLSTVFTLMLSAGGKWVEHMMYDPFPSLPVYLVYYLNAFIGTWILLYAVIRSLIFHAQRISIPAEKSSPSKWFLVSLILCLSVWIVFLMNQFPGSMESDHMRQLLHLTKGIWENKNPLISSILVYGCYKSALFLGWTPNTGLFLYSIFQIIILALAVSYGTFIMAREGYGKRYLLPLCLFNAAVPYNVFYSYGMWKDTLFAILMLLTVLESVDLYLLSKNNIPFSGIRYFILAITALCCGLSRNSGMFSILIMIPSLLLMLHTDKLKYRMAGALLTGLIISILISGPVFRELGIELSTDTVYASSVPLQQIGRIITEEKEISEEERKMLEAVIDLQTVRDSYDPVCADPMKDAVSDSSSYLAEHRLEYLKLWFELGKKHPLTYYRAYRDLMRMYYDPNVSSEVSYRWIYENSLGIYRDPKLLPKADFAYYEQILELPAVNLLQRPGALLWGLLILASILINRRLKERIAFLIPFLGIYLGLFLTAPVALFRYVYACFLAAPFLLMIAFLPSDRNLKEDLKEWDREL